MSACSFAAGEVDLVRRCGRRLDHVHLRAEGVHDGLARKDGVGRRSGALILAQRSRSGEACGQQQAGGGDQCWMLPRPRQSVVRSRHFTLPPCGAASAAVTEPISVGDDSNQCDRDLPSSSQPRSDRRPSRYCQCAAAQFRPGAASHRIKSWAVRAARPWSPRVRQPVTSLDDRKSHIQDWSHTPCARIPVPPSARMASTWRLGRINGRASFRRFGP